jgi:hypothetical protein
VLFWVSPPLVAPLFILLTLLHYYITDKGCAIFFLLYILDDELFRACLVMHRRFSEGFSNLWEKSWKKKIVQTI